MMKHEVKVYEPLVVSPSPRLGVDPASCHPEPCESAAPARVPSVE